MLERKRFLRFVFTALGLLTAGAVTGTGVAFAIAAGEQIIVQIISGKYSAFISLVQVLEAVAITLAAAAFAMDILDNLVSQVWSRDLSSHDVVILLRKMEGDAQDILIPAVVTYSALKVLEFAAHPTWPADPNGWVEPVAFSGLILLSLLIHRVLGHQENANGCVGVRSETQRGNHTETFPKERKE